MAQQRRTRPGQIAVVEDSEFNRTLLADVLSEEGHTVTAFDSAEALLVSSHIGTFDVVVTDLVMEGMGGLELLQKVRAGYPHTEVVVVSVLSDANTAVRAMRAGAADYIVKPLVPDVLRLSVARCLEKRRLLDQNQRLQRDLELALSGQRVLACDNPQQIADITLSALLHHLGMDAGLVAVGGEPLASQLLDEAQVEPALKLAARAANGSVQTAAASGALLSMGPAVIGTFGDDDDGIQLYAGRRGGNSVLSTDDLADVSFLLRHAHNALTTARTYAQARQEATRDSLTGLYNARHLELLLNSMVDTAKREETSLSVLFLDLDHFKQVNDTHGHLDGSKLLIELAAVLKSCVRDNDLVCRYGGDEFIVVLQSCGPPCGGRIAERIRGTIAGCRFLSRQGKELRVEASIGIACYPDHAEDTRGLFELADMAMYRAKETSRNAICIVDGEMITAAAAARSAS